MIENSTKHLRLTRDIDENAPGIDSEWIREMMFRCAAAISNELEALAPAIYRNLESINEAGFPVCNERIDGRSVWQFADVLKAGYSIPLTTTELMSLI